MDAITGATEMKSAPSTDSAKLEREVIKTTLRRYKRWLKTYGAPKPWGHPQCVQQKDAYDHIVAVHALYEATRGR